MSRTHLGIVMVAAAGLAGASSRSAAGEATGPATTMSGDALFRTYCASCHGTSGAGDGKLAEVLRVRPADLTTLARRSGGTFKADKVRKAIDGRDGKAAHGQSDMPVWGDAFTRSSEGGGAEAVKDRIDALVSYLESIQAK